MSRSPEDSASLQLLTTADGSQTLLNNSLGSTYHSRHGAMTESEHVFIGKGFSKLLEKGMTEVTVLEMGFGTGLNALLTFLRGKKESVSVRYHALEAFPVPEGIWKSYELPEKLRGNAALFRSLHQTEWNRNVELTSMFRLHKHAVTLQEHRPKTTFDLIYYDAFEPETQPELWTAEIFSDLFAWTNPGGVLTTYCCKGYVRRNMLAAGWEVSKVPGPPGKREMIVAKKPL